MTLGDVVAPLSGRKTCSICNNVTLDGVEVCTLTDVTPCGITNTSGERVGTQSQVSTSRLEIQRWGTFTRKKPTSSDRGCPEVSVWVPVLS